MGPTTAQKAYGFLGIEDGEALKGAVTTQFNSHNAFKISYIALGNMSASR